MNVKKKKTLSTLDKYVIFSFVVLILFTITEIVVGAITQTEQTTLITCFFATFGGELLCLAMIKRLKLKNGCKNDETFNRQLESDTDSNSGNSRCN